MDSDSDSPFNYSWPSFPKMRIRRRTSKQEKSQSVTLRRPPAQSTFGAAARLAAMLNGRDQIYANAMLVNQMSDTDIKYSIAGVTGDSTPTESTRRDGKGGRPYNLAEEPSSCQSRERPPRAEEREQLAPSPCPPSAESALSQLSGPARGDTLSQTGSSPQETCALSPSLVALEVDSEEDEPLVELPFSPHCTPPQPGVAPRACGGEERDSFDASPDLGHSRTHSPSPSNPPTHDSEEPGVRLRSYSYSSPKVSVVRPRFSRDGPTSDLSEDGVLSSGGRALVQALSLSKSLSLLSTVKQRASSLPDQPQEKRELSFRKRAQSAEDEGSVALAQSLQHLTLSEFLKEIEEEEWDKYIIPSKGESEKYKVSRTFSFLKSRMSSTRNKSKGKEKGKEKEVKEKQTNGHQLTAGTCAGLTLCLVCDKPALGKDLLQCSSCNINIHKSCRDAASPCMKKLQDKYAVTTKTKTAPPPQNSAGRESPTPCVFPTSMSMPTMMSRDKKEHACPLSSLSKSVPIVAERKLSEGPDVDNESSTWRNHSQSEELLPVIESSPSTDSSVIEDVVDTPLKNDFREDLLDYEAESWSLAVDHKFCKKQDKRVVKRQDVIYELMQTEVHHIQTLTIMAEIFRKGMKEELQLDLDTVDKIFPCLDELLDFHKAFFCAMKERRQACTQHNSTKNFLIDRIGDILVQQFSCENAEEMKRVYGEFCSHHTEAVNFFKELQQQNKKFQVFIKQQSNNSLVRRKEIPECILLVTQRITKYPVLLERILQYSQENTEEHANVSRALGLIREVIAAVDLKVSEYDREQKLLDILNRMENKSSTKLKNGHAFRKQDLLTRARTLKHEGLVYWKTATGRLKDILALLLTDTLIFLQEKDQKFIFAAVDQKPPVISLQKLIVREVANEERGMFLISASAAGPEMYEVHTGSKEERNTWMRLIREAVESCPEEEEEATSESEEDRRAAEARAQKIQKLQETLNTQDRHICSSLEEKLKIFAELRRPSVKEEEDAVGESRLLVQVDPDEVPQGTMLLTAALREVEKLTTMLTSQPGSSDSTSQETLPESNSPVRLSDFPSVTSIQGSPVESEHLNAPSSSSTSLLSDSDRDVEWTDTLLQCLPDLRRMDTTGVDLQVAQSVQNLTQLLYSLQAAVTIQDSCFEVQRLLLQESGRPPRPACPRGSALQEQEKQREELAGVLRLRGQLRQERQRWERECELRRSQQEAQEGQLERREQECQRQAQRLQRERAELDGQLLEYRQNLDRLREGERLVSRQRQELDAQQRALQGWRHSRQRSLPVMMVPLDGCQGSGHHQYNSLDGNSSLFVSEVALQATFNNRHRHQRSGSLVCPGSPDTGDALSSLRQSRGHQAAPTCHRLLTQNHGAGGTPYVPPFAFAGRGITGQGRDQMHNDVNTLQHNFSNEKWSSGGALSGPLLYPGGPQPGPPGSIFLSPQTCVPIETENGEDGSEENIVYL